VLLRAWWHGAALGVMVCHQPNHVTARDPAPLGHAAESKLRKLRSDLIDADQWAWLQ